MRKRWGTMVLLLVIIGIGIALIIPASHFRLVGIAKREATFDGWPTSYWAAALKKDPFAMRTNPPRDIGRVLREGGEAAVPVLIEMLSDEDDEIRFQAALALASMDGDQARAATPALVKLMLSDTQEHVLLLAARTVERCAGDEVVPALVGALRENPSHRRRAWAAVLLGEFGPKAKAAIPALVTAIEDPHVAVRVAAARSLWLVDSHASPASLLVLAEARKCDYNIGQPVWALLRPRAQEFYPDLLSALKVANPDRRSCAAIAIENLLSDEPMSIAPRLVTTLGQSESDLDRMPALRAIDDPNKAPRGQPAPEVIAALLEALNDPIADVRVCAAAALGYCGTAGRAAIPKMLDAIRSADPAIQVGAALALRRLRPGEETIPTLLEYLKDPSLEIRKAALVVLETSSPAGRVAIPELVSILRTGDPALRFRTEQALMTLRPDKEAVPGLVACCTEPALEVRRSAIRVLSACGADALPALPLLVKALDESGEIASEAARTLGAIGPQAREAVPALLAAYQREPGGIMHAWHALKQIDPMSVENIAGPLSTPERPAQQRGRGTGAASAQ